MSIKIQLLDSQIDLANEIGFGLNYSIDDIRNVEKKNSNYSKTITLAGSKNNNIILGGLFDVNSDFSRFNPNIKTPAKIIVNSETVIEGFLQLKSIEKDTETELQGNKIVYKCTINSNAADFFTDIKDKKIEDLDFSKYNHLYNVNSIRNSWNNTVKDVYVYPLLFKDSNNYEVSDFTPSIFHKAYLKRIALEAGYSLGGGLMDETTIDGANYAKEIIPFNGEEVVLTPAEVASRYNVITANNNIFYTEGNGAAPIGTIEQSVTNLNNFASYTPNKTGVYNLELDLVISQVWSPQAAAFRRVLTNGVYNTASPYKFNIVTQIYKNGSPIFAPIYSEVSAPSTFANANNVFVDYPVIINTSNIYLENTDVIEVKYSILNNNAGTLEYTLNFGSGATVPIQFTLNVDSTRFNTFKSIANGSLSEGETIFLNSYIPKKTKQSELITDLIKRKNAYISIDPDNDKKIIIDTRQQYFAKGGILDWSDKKDNNQKTEIKLISELQNKEFLFTYKPDKDFYNDSYTSSLDGSIFGEQSVEFNNDFAKGEKKIETPFSPTPLIQNKDSQAAAIVPAIPTEAPKNNIRVLYYGGLINCIGGNSWSLKTTNYSTYPYAGHFDNPINPTIDLNFGKNTISYYPEQLTTTNNNIYNRFWSNYIEQLTEGKLVSMYMYLNSTDISYIRHNLNTKIYVNDSYYYINKIVDYNPLKEGLTKVEFLKINEGVSFFGVTETSEEPDKGIIEKAKEKRKKQGDEIKADKGDENILKGKGNYATEDAKSALVMGDNNIVSGKNSIIQGDNNSILEGVVNGFIIGSNNKTITESNTGYIGEVFYRGGQIDEQIENITLPELVKKEQDGELIKDRTYLSSNNGNTYIAKNESEFLLNGYKDVKCVKSSYYTTIDTFEPGKSYNVNDLVIYGNRVWKATANTAYIPVNFYELSVLFEEITDTYYEIITLNAKFSKNLEIIKELSDNRGNVVNSDLHGGFLYSDWNDLNAYNNVCFGFMNNLGGVYNNNCKLIANNFMGDVFNNKNNGNIVRNSGETNTEIRNNVNNGDIGSLTSGTGRALTVEDTIVNK